MPSKIDARLAELGITLPDTPAPAANYVPFVVVRQHRLRLRPDQPRRRRADHRQARRRHRRRRRRRRGAHLRAGADRPAPGGLRRRPRPGGAGGEAHRLRQLGARLHRPAEGDQRRLGPDGRGLRRARAATPARRSASPRCRSGSRSRSKVSSRSPELPARLPRRADRPPRPARPRRRASSRTAAPPPRRRSPPATASSSTSSAPPTARRWCSTTTRCRG